jgi:hypothetical protein
MTRITVPGDEYDHPCPRNKTWPHDYAHHYVQAVGVAGAPTEPDIVVIYCVRCGHIIEYHCENALPEAVPS